MINRGAGLANGFLVQDADYFVHKSGGIMNKQTGIMNKH
jgi:hypothetical protein